MLKYTTRMIQEMKFLMAQQVLSANSDMVLDQNLTRPSNMTDSSNKDPTIVPSNTIPSFSDNDSNLSTKFLIEHPLNSTERVKERHPSNTRQKDGATYCLVEFITDKYGILNLGVINKGNASGLDIYSMKAYYLFAKLRVKEINENSHAVPALNNLRSSYNAAQRAFLKQLKRDFRDCHGFKQELQQRQRRHCF